MSVAVGVGAASASASASVSAAEVVAASAPAVTTSASIRGLGSSSSSSSSNSIKPPSAFDDSVAQARSAVDVVLQQVTEQLQERHKLVIEALKRELLAYRRALREEQMRSAGLAQQIASLQATLQQSALNCEQFGGLGGALADVRRALDAADAIMSSGSAQCQVREGAALPQAAPQAAPAATTGEPIDPGAAMIPSTPVVYLGRDSISSQAGSANGARSEPPSVVARRPVPSSAQRTRAGGAQPSLAYRVPQSFLSPPPPHPSRRAVYRNPRNFRHSFSHEHRSSPFPLAHSPFPTSARR